jgi:CRP/FNR family transcriptional regulator, cyclic AMP receptor protein
MHALEPAHIPLIDLAEEVGAEEPTDPKLRSAQIPVLRLTEGRVHPVELRDVLEARGHVSGFLVVRGTLLGDVELGGRTATQLLGPGDLVAVPSDEDGSLPQHRHLTVSEGRAVLAILDERVIALAQHWPEFAARLLEASLRQIERATAQQAISQLSRVEMRLLALMLHLASRWGRVSACGLVVTVPLTHTVLGQLVGARRPTISLALKWLDDEGLLTRREDGAWLIAPAAAQLLTKTPAAAALVTPAIAAPAPARADAA